MVHVPSFQSTLPSRGATCRALLRYSKYGISIHAPLAGSDLTRMEMGFCCQEFQSTLPSRGATGGAQACAVLRFEFQSTLPSRGATPGSDRPRPGCGNFNPRSPRGERPRQVFAAPTVAHISIHAPLAGSDAWEFFNHPEVDDFNPRSPRGERL